MNTVRAEESQSCPLPLSQYDQIVLGHGSGGRLTADLISKLMVPAFSNPTLLALEDQASLGVLEGSVAVTTDSFVVKPIFFPGGDIGRLAVFGTVNDLAVGGAIPRSITAAFILEEGFPIADLRRIVNSMSAACREAGIELVAGDTKVVDRGKGDQIFITTTGIGTIPAGIRFSSRTIRPGDLLIVSGTVGDHGMAVMSLREGIEFETELRSDAAPLTGLIQGVLAKTQQVRCMRDPTRGGLLACANEWAQASGVCLRLDESKIPVRREVRGASELLGIDVLSVANEGKVVFAVAPEAAAAVLEALHNHPLGKDAALIGSAFADSPGRVIVKSIAGGERIALLPTGELLPRIC